MAEFEADKKRHIVIIGGGVIGSTTAYFLTRHPKYNPKLHTITLLEATAIASGASGKAGGLLGLWAYPVEIVPLSYRLHRELAEQHGGAEKWGYRRLGCGSIEAVVTDGDIKATEETRRQAELARANGDPKPNEAKAQKDENGPLQANFKHSVGSVSVKGKDAVSQIFADQQPAAATADQETKKDENGLPQASFKHSVDSVSVKGKDAVTQLFASAHAVTTPPAPTIAPNGNAGLNGSVHPEDATLNGETAPLPIQASAEPVNGTTTHDSENSATQVVAPPAPVAPTEAQASTNASNNDASKEWEKLPKQDTQAASLLSDSPLPADLTWISPRLVQSYQTMGRPGATETAQVHPYHFTTQIASLARAAGVDIRLGAKVTSIDHVRGEGGCVRGVTYLERSTNTTKTIEHVTDVVVTAGPWTGTLLPKAKVEGLRAHSVVWEADVAPYAVFTDIKLPGAWAPEHRKVMNQGRRHKGNVDPEIYARPFNEVYACGEPDSAVPLPATADLVRTDEGQCDDLVAYTATISPVLAAAPVKTKQACYLPRHMVFGKERPPLIGPTTTPGLWVAAGHTCWGIQNGPGTGCLMAELLFDGKARSANIDKLDPRKFKI